MLHFATLSGKVTGEILVDAKSGDSGNGMRDRKMHREVLESDRYLEITFRPDHVEGTLLPRGKSSVRVHGVFWGMKNPSTLFLRVNESTNR